MLNLVNKIYLSQYCVLFVSITLQRDFTVSKPSFDSCVGVISSYFVNRLLSSLFYRHIFVHSNTYMLFAGWEVRMVKNFDLGLEKCCPKPHWLKFYVPVKSKLQHPPPGIPREFDASSCTGGREFDYQS